MLPSVSFRAAHTGKTDSSTTKLATTFTIGSWFGLVMLLRIHCGSVSMPAPAVNVVTTISSKREGERQQATGQQRGAHHGEGDVAKVCQVSAPRSAEASSTFGCRRRNRAMTLL